MELRVGDLVKTIRWAPAGLIEREGGPHFLKNLDPGTILLITEVRQDRVTPRSYVCYEAETGSRYHIPGSFLTMIDTHTTED